MRRANPGIGDAMLTDSLLAAYLPGHRQRRDAGHDGEAAAAGPVPRQPDAGVGVQRPATAPVLVTTALPPAALAAAQAAASRAGLSLADWLARAATQAAR